MKKQKLYYVILAIIFFVGCGLAIWAVVDIYNYPEYNTIRKKALASVQPRYTIALILMIGAYVFTYLKGLFK